MNNDQNPPGTLARLALWGVLAVVLVHSAAVALWVAPYNLLRQTVGPERLSSYILPTWEQGWSVFAPIADYRTDRLEMRALLRDDSGTEYKSDWTPITSREVAASVRYHPFPSRTVLITNRLAGRVMKPYYAMNAAQKKTFAAADLGTSLDGLRAALLSGAAEEKERESVDSFMGLESSIEYFVSGLAVAVWGDQVIGVQYRKNHVDVPSYSRPHSQRQVVSGYDLYSNVRPVHSLSNADRKAFGDYVHEFRIGDR